jgi:hypothetical protein
LFKWAFETFMRFLQRLHLVLNAPFAVVHGRMNLQAIEIATGRKQLKSVGWVAPHYAWWVMRIFIILAA